MQISIVMTVLGSDRPGLVSSLADTVSNHGGNWLESRMARLAGQFAGIVRIECPAESVDSLVQELENSEKSGLAILVVREESSPAQARRTLIVDVVGNDRPGIVRELTAALTRADGNIEELTTSLESAPMSGYRIFRARGIISIPDESEISTLTTTLETLGDDLTVDITT